MLCFFFLCQMVIRFLMMIFTAKKMKKDKHGHKSSPKGSVKHRNGEVKMLSLIDIPRFRILMVVSEINQLRHNFGLISGIYIVQESPVFKIFSLAKHLTELYLPIVKCFSTFEGDVSNMSGSSEAPTYEGLSISERKDVLKSVSNFILVFVLLWTVQKNLK